MGSFCLLGIPFEPNIWQTSEKMNVTKIFLLLAITSFSSCALLNKQNSASTNAANGSLSPKKGDAVVLFATSDLGDDLSAELGLPILSADFQSLKKEYGNHALWLDGGHFGDNLTLFDHLGISATMNPLKAETFQAGKSKVGVISVQSGEEDLAKLEKTILDQSIALKKLDCDVVVVLTDLPISCRDSKLSPHSPAVRKPNEPHGFCEGALASILKKLPEGTIQAAIVSGARRDLHHFIFPRFSSHETAGIAVISGGLRGAFVNVVSLVPGDSSLTRIEGSIQVHGQTKFHGNTVTPDLAIQNLLAPLRAQREGERKEILGTFAEKLALNPSAESSLTDFIADVIKEQTHADVVISPLGVVTHAPVAEIAAGDFSRADLNSLFPLPIPIVTIEVKGEELRTMFQLSETGLRGFSSVAGVKLRLLNPEDEAPKLQNGIRNRVLSVDGPEDDSEIESNATYHVAVPLALVQGADDWQDFVETKGFARRFKVAANSDQAQDLKQIVASWLSHQKTGSRMGVPASRLTFVKGKAAKSHGKRHKRARARKAKRRSQPAKT
jgi:hypothetical protein